MMLVQQCKMFAILKCFELTSNLEVLLEKGHIHVIVGSNQLTPRYLREVSLVGNVSVTKEAETY
jgi:hypothetical protein